MSGHYKDHKVLNKRISEIKKQIPVGGRYRHNRNKEEYEVLDVVIFSEDPEQTFVIYKGLYSHGLVWARPWEMWNEEVEVDGKKVPRFKKID